MKEATFAQRYSALFDRAGKVKNYIEPNKPEHKTAFSIGRFSGGGISHVHYEDGKRG